MNSQFPAARQGHTGLAPGAQCPVPPWAHKLLGPELKVVVINLRVATQIRGMYCGDSSTMPVHNLIFKTCSQNENED
jgi:hypothetical protein